MCYFIFLGGVRWIKARALHETKQTGITKRTAFRLRRFLAKCHGYFGLGRNRATWDRRRHDASYIPMASTELRDGKKQAHGFCF